jgi:hypothetical protein
MGEYSGKSNKKDDDWHGKNHLYLYVNGQPELPFGGGW